MACWINTLNIRTGKRPELNSFVFLTLLHSPCPKKVQVTDILDQLCEHVCVCMENIHMSLHQWLSSVFSCWDLLSLDGGETVSLTIKLTKESLYSLRSSFLVPGHSPLELLNQISHQFIDVNLSCWIVSVNPTPLTHDECYLFYFIHISCTYVASEPFLLLNDCVCIYVYMYLYVDRNMHI